VTCFAKQTEADHLSHLTFSHRPTMLLSVDCVTSRFNFKTIEQSEPWHSSCDLGHRTRQWKGQEGWSESPSSQTFSQWDGLIIPFRRNDHWVCQVSVKRTRFLRKNTQNVSARKNLRQTELRSHGTVPVKETDEQDWRRRNHGTRWCKNQINQMAERLRTNTIHVYLLCDCFSKPRYFTSNRW
jgi:hypothetical protein